MFDMFHRSGILYIESYPQIKRRKGVRIYTHVLILVPFQSNESYHDIRRSAYKIAPHRLRTWRSTVSERFNMERSARSRKSIPMDMRNDTLWSHGSLWVWDTVVNCLVTTVQVQPAIRYTKRCWLVSICSLAVCTSTFRWRNISLEQLKSASSSSRRPLGLPDQGTP